MPRRDGSGPEGRGPLTGGARGNCASGAPVVPNDQAGPNAPAIGRRRVPLGIGSRLRGLGRRIRGGRGRRR
ncbi:MAG: DUF5320 domain-containing protein [Anaerolineae bacterium]